jgi:hypothetical protein
LSICNINLSTSLILSVRQISPSKDNFSGNIERINSFSTSTMMAPWKRKSSLINRLHEHRNRINLTLLVWNYLISLLHFDFVTVPKILSRCLTL